MKIYRIGPYASYELRVICYHCGSELGVGIDDIQSYLRMSDQPEWANGFYFYQYMSTGMEGVGDPFLGFRCQLCNRVNDIPKEAVPEAIWYLRGLK